MEEQLEYVKALWVRGFILGIVAVGAVATGLIVVGLPLMALASAVGRGGDWAMEWTAALGLIWFPAVLGLYAKGLKRI